MRKSVKVAKVVTLLLLISSLGWLLLCLGSAAMQTSDANIQEVLRSAWPPFPITALIGILLVVAALCSDEWRGLLKLGWWTLGVSLAALGLIALAIRHP